MSDKVPGPWRIEWYSNVRAALDFVRDRPDLGEGITEKRTLTTSEVGALCFPESTKVTA